MRHPHFTKHIEIRLATGRIPAETHLLCLADSTRIEEIEDSTTTISTEQDTVFGAQAFVDMTVGRRWAVNLGLKYLATELETVLDLLRGLCEVLLERAAGSGEAGARRERVAV